MTSPATVATLIANPAQMRLSDAAITLAAQGAPGYAGFAWLDEGIAADLFFDAPARATRAALASALADEPFDVVVQPAADRSKRLLVADMDSTLIGQECIDELAVHAGVADRVAAITERAMRGEIAFEPALRERVGLLAGLPERVIAEVLETRIALNPGARILTQTMRARGAYVAIVSGGFRQFTSAIARRIGADEERANILVTEAGALTGEVAEPILGHKAKLTALLEIAAAHGLSLHETMAVGDGANDLAMLGAAGLGVAYRAKPKVAAAAQARIDHGDLTALLYIQGVPRERFVES
jgi:phosphoserine phosphatase